MDKQEYLIKKGIIPDPTNGVMFIVYSTPEVVDMIQLPIWQVEKSNFGRIIPKNSEWVDVMRYHFHEAPYQMDIRLDEEFGVNECYGTGICDLWGFTYWCSLNEGLAKAYFEEEKKRVQQKYTK